MTYFRKHFRAVQTCVKVFLCIGKYYKIYLLERRAEETNWPIKFIQGSFMLSPTCTTKYQLTRNLTNGTASCAEFHPVSITVVLYPVLPLSPQLTKSWHILHGIVAPLKTTPSLMILCSHGSISSTYNTAFKLPPVALKKHLGTDPRLNCVQHLEIQIWISTNRIISTSYPCNTVRSTFASWRFHSGRFLN